MNLIVFDRPPALLAHGVITRCGIGAPAVASGRSGSPPTPYAIDVLAEMAGETPVRFRRVDRHGALALAAARQALAGAGSEVRKGADDNWGVFLGSSLGCWGSNAEYFSDLESLTPLELRPALFARTVSNAATGEIAIAHHIGGASETFVSGWTAGAEALAEAASRLSEGRCRHALAGGVEAPDPVLNRMHAALRSSPGLGWLPSVIDEAAALTHLVAHNASGRGREPILDAFARFNDPDDAWTPGEILRQLEPPRPELILVANTLRPEVLARWRASSGDVPLMTLPDTTGEIGAAGAPAAIAMACERLIASQQEGTIVVVSRGIEGALALLVVRTSGVL